MPVIIAYIYKCLCWNTNKQWQQATATIFKQTQKKQPANFDVNEYYSLRINIRASRIFSSLMSHFFHAVYWFLWVWIPLWLFHTIFIRFEFAWLECRGQHKHLSRPFNEHLYNISRTTCPNSDCSNTLFSRHKFDKCSTNNGNNRINRWILTIVCDLIRL